MHVCIFHPPHQLLSHLSIPDETFFYTKAKTKVHYLGMLNDGQSFFTDSTVYNAVSVFTDSTVYTRIHNAAVPCLC